MPNNHGESVGAFRPVSPDFGGLAFAERLQGRSKAFAGRLQAGTRGTRPPDGRSCGSMTDFSDVVLDSIGVQSYADLVALGPEDILRLLDDKKPPLQPSDAFLAVLVISAVSELQATTRALDSAKRGFERATIVLASLGVILTAAGVVVALLTLAT